MECQKDLNGNGGESPRSRSTSIPPLPPSSSITVNDPDLDLDTAIKFLEEEKKKSEKLKQINYRLNEQLEEAHQTNESLTNDLQKITNEWESLREELILKEDEWRDEEHAFNEYYTAEHGRLLMLWRDAVFVKRMFAEMQMNTERDLNRFKDDFTNCTRDLIRIFAGVKESTSSARLEVIFILYKLSK